MKVLMLSHMYPNPVNPTAGIFVHEQVKALRALGHDVRVMSTKLWAPPLVPRYAAYRRVPRVDHVEGIPVLYPKRLALQGSPLGRLDARAMLAAIRRPMRQVYRAWPFDVVHAHMVSPDGWAAARAGHALGVPVVATAHRADVLDLPSRSPAIRRVVADAVATIDQIVAVSRKMADAAEGLATPPRPVDVVPNGADTALFFPRAMEEARALLDLPQGERIISYVGKLVPRKGVDTLIEAMGILARRDAPLPLLVAAGIGEMRDAMEARARGLGVAHRVRFLGKVPHDRVPLVISAGDVFVLPSLSEGLPTVVCEAMACGRPVVATAVDGTPEIVRDGETGFLVPPTDPDALAAALARVLDDPALAARMSFAADLIARERYTWDANARDMQRIYSSLVA
ncbi:MAG: glycosyltransferase family 4 protein [Actinomycetota bacterium]